MLWGYAGVFPGEFGVYQGDVQMNKLQFAVDHGFQCAHIPFKELQSGEERREQIGNFVEQNDFPLSIGIHADWFNEDRDVPRRQIDEFLDALDTVGPLVRAPIITMGAGRVHRFMAKPSLQEQMDVLAELLTPLAKGCHEAGRPLGIENHGDYYCSDLVELCRRVLHLGIFLDTGNTYLIGEQSVPACREAAPYTIGTHFKDHLVHPDPSTLTFVIGGAALGEGHVGLEQIYRDLLELAPDPEKLVMQWELVPPKGEDPFQALERSWAFIRRLTGGAA